MKSLIVVGLLLSSILSARMGGNLPQYADFDSDKDGKITKTEFEDAQQRHMTKNAEEGRMLRNAGNMPIFEDIDTNHDGSFDAAEFSKHQQERRESMMGMGQGQNK